MKGWLAIASTIFLGLTSSALALDHKPSSSASAAAYMPGQILVEFSKRASETAMAAAHSQVGGREIRRFANFERLKLVKLPAAMSVEDGLQRYRNLPGVESAQPDFIRETGGAPNDPYFANGKLWGLQNTGTPGADIHATAAWDLSTGSRDIVVMVIDTGIDYNHEDLADNMWRNTADCNNNGIDDDGNGYIDDCYGINPAYNNSDPWDDSGHGSHVAGIIGAIGNNNLGVVGVNWQVSLMPCKAFDWQGHGPDDNIIACLDYALTMKQGGVNIIAINNSYGGAGFDSILRDKILALAHQGILFIAQAGPEAVDEGREGKEYYPAMYDPPNIIAVAATTQQDKIYPASGFGGYTVHLGAPGDFIYSTVTNNGYDLYSGTSMAAAFVTGVAALLKAQDPSRDWRAIKNLILTGGDQNQDLSNPFSRTITGKRLNAYGSMTCSNSTLLARFRPKDSGLEVHSIMMGSTVDLSVLNINCAAPNGPVSVTVQPGNVVIPLVDDATGTDVAAGDGLYSATWVPPSEGDYTLSFPDTSTWQATVLPAYRYDVAGFNWRVIEGTNLDLSDDSSKTIQPPFPVNLGGFSYSQVYVDCNGKLNFDWPYTDFQNYSLVDSLASKDQRYFHLVAGFWDDLLCIPNTSQNVFWAVAGERPQRELVIEWRDVSRASGCTDPTATIKFQIVLPEGSDDVLVNYGHTNFGGPPQCAVGDKGAYATAGILLTWPSASQYSYDQPNLTDNLALKYSRIH